MCFDIIFPLVWIGFSDLPNNVYENFQGRNPYNIFIAILENQCLHSEFKRPFAIRGHSTTKWTEFCHFLIPPLRGQFLYPERGEKQTFFDPLPLHLVHVVIECPLNQKPQEQKWTSYHYMCLIKGQF